MSDAVNTILRMNTPQLFSKSNCDLVLAVFDSKADWFRSAKDVGQVKSYVPISLFYHVECIRSRGTTETFATTSR